MKFEDAYMDWAVWSRCNFECEHLDAPLLPILTLMSVVVDALIAQARFVSIFLSIVSWTDASSSLYNC